MKQLYLFCFVLSSFWSMAQVASFQLENYPVFPDCADVGHDAMEACFNQTLQQFIHDNFKVPESVSEKDYRGNIHVLFEVNKKGDFKILYVDSAYEDLKEEVRRVFDQLPKVDPPTYNGKPSYMQFTFPIAIPLRAPGVAQTPPPLWHNLTTENQLKEDQFKNEYDDIINQPYSNEEYVSNLNIPLSHHNYSLFDPAMNRVGNNSHTAQKPYIYSEVNKYYDFAEENGKLMQDRKTWFGRKLWNEHMVTIKGKDYWMTLDPGVDLQLGRDLDADLTTYNNTRIVMLQGGLGKNLSFHGVIYESQGRFADYFNRYAESIQTGGGNPAIIPGQGIAKSFKSDSYDYPVATGYFSYSPAEFFNLQFGHGKTHIGDGYRSLFMSDNASPYPFMRLNTTFWKLKYTNTWMSLRDPRIAIVEDGAYRPKYIANHYLSINVTKRLNIGLFESVVWENGNGRGFDVNYLNPIIFYRAIEFSTGPKGGNAFIGLAGKYKVSDRVNVYGQFAIDEFSSLDVFEGKGSYKNKTGYQIGAKYYDAFNLPGLYIQGEYNRVRPYTYSHNTVILNFAHLNQPVAHTLGANFSEFVGIARYQSGRFYGDAKVVVAKRGFDFNTDEDDFNYGGDIFRSEYEPMPGGAIGHTVAQGNTTNFLHTELQLGYLINPATNLKIYGSVIFRNFDPLVDTDLVFKNSSTWVNFGIRTDIFNWYYDF